MLYSTFEGSQATRYGKQGEETLLPRAHAQGVKQLSVVVVVVVVVRTNITSLGVLGPERLVK